MQNGFVSQKLLDFSKDESGNEKSLFLGQKE
jgi:hypothetical protein